MILVINVRLGTVKLSHCTFCVKLTFLRLNLRMIPDYYIALAVHYEFSQNAFHSHNCLGEEYQRVPSCHFKEEGPKRLCEKVTK